MQKRQLQNLKVKNLVSALNEVGCLISLQEHTVYILSGLRSKDDLIVSAISAKSKSKPLKRLSHFSWVMRAELKEIH